MAQCLMASQKLCRARGDTWVENHLDQAKIILNEKANSRLGKKEILIFTYILTARWQWLERGESGKKTQRGQFFTM